MSLENLVILSEVIESNPGKLRTWLKKDYDLEEFRDLCQDLQDLFQDLSFKYDVLPGENLNKARSFAERLVRQQQQILQFLKYLEENSPKHFQLLYGTMIVNEVVKVNPATQANTNAIFDSFLSHHNSDKPIIREVYAQLTQQSIKPWLDEFDLSSGHWNVIFADLLPNLRSAVIFSGEHGFGSEQKREIRAFMEQQKRGKSFKIIPVILNNGIDIFELEPLLALDIRIDFNQDADPISKLIRFIKSIE